MLREESQPILRGLRPLIGMRLCRNRARPRRLRAGKRHAGVLDSAIVMCIVTGHVERRLPRSHPTPEAGGHTHDGREHSSEMTLISESAGKRDFCERQRRVAQQVLCTVNASAK